MTDASRQQLQTVYSMNGEVVIRPVAGETLVVPIRGKLVEMESVFVFNGVGAFIVSQIDGRTSLGEICDRVVERFDVTRAEAERDVLAFADELLQGELVIAGP